jgi:hypothetical protein
MMGLIAAEGEGTQDVGTVGGREVSARAPVDPAHGIVRAAAAAPATFVDSVWLLGSRPRQAARVWLELLAGAPGLLQPRRGTAEPGRQNQEHHFAADLWVGQVGDAVAADARDDLARTRQSRCQRAAAKRDPNVLRRRRGWATADDRRRRSLRARRTGQPDDRRREEAETGKDNQRTDPPAQSGKLCSPEAGGVRLLASCRCHAVPFSRGLLLGRIVKAGRFQRGYVSRNRRATADQARLRALIETIPETGCEA